MFFETEGKIERKNICLPIKKKEKIEMTSIATDAPLSFYSNEEPIVKVEY